MSAISFITLLLLLLSHSLTVKSGMSDFNINKFIIDVDAGVDDAMAILLAIEKQKIDKDIEIVAITCVRGNAELPNVIINVLKTLKIAKVKIPVYVGLNSSFMWNIESDNYFGKDGFGDQPYENPPKVSEAEPEHAVTKMIEIIMKEPGKVSIICLAPLTNLAAAMRINEKFRDAINHLVIMGGSVYGISNVTPFIEFNSFMDPEANFIVFNSSLNNPKPIVLVSWDCAMSIDVPMSWRKDTLGTTGQYASFFNGIESTALKNHNFATWNPADLFAMVAALFPEVVLEDVPLEITGIMQGELRGMLRADISNRLDKEVKNTRVVKKLDKDGVMAKILKYLGSQ